MICGVPGFLRRKAPDSPKVKSFTRFFSCEGCPPPVCLRCSPGLFRHACGVSSCHTSSMPAKPHLGLTQNSSPTTLANERRAAQIAGSRCNAPVARRSGRNSPSVPKRHPQMAQSPAKGHGPRRHPCGVDGVDHQPMQHRVPPTHAPGQMRPGGRCNPS